MNIIRLFSTTARAVATSELAQLRKKTGFTLMHCRKALQLCDNDVTKAEEWLKAEAKKLGWEKAMKLQHRTASEGLIGVMKSGSKVVMVEVNCETDFVARNEKFVSLTQVVANTCFTQGFVQPRLNEKKMLTSEEIGNLQCQSDEKLIDEVSKCVGELGEKIVLARALCYEGDKDTEIQATVHPPSSDASNIHTGKYGAFVAVRKQSEGSVKDSFDEFGSNLCKHIIGLNPKTIGVAECVQGIEEITEKEEEIIEKKMENLEDEDSERIEDEVEVEDLVNQKFLLDPDVTVGQLLKTNGVRVIDFHRFECGEEKEEFVTAANESDQAERQTQNAVI